MIGFQAKNCEPIKALVDWFNRLGYLSTDYDFLIERCKNLLSLPVALIPSRWLCLPSQGLVEA